MVFEGVLSPIFDPMLKFPIFAVVLIMSFLITLITTVIYKYTTNQSLMKDLKDEMKALQGEMKTLKDNPSKMMEIQKKSMQTNMKYMSHSMKATLITFLPIIFIFGWMNAHIAYQPIVPGESFTLDALFDRNAFGEAQLIVPD